MESAAVYSLWTTADILGDDSPSRIDANSSVTITTFRSTLRLGSVVSPWAIIATLFIVHVLWSIKVRFWHLAEYVGPPVAAFTRLWLCKVLYLAKSSQTFVDINKRYGSIARVGPNHLVTDDPELVQRMCGARSHWTRAPWFDSIRINPEISNIVSERDHGRHNRLRHKMAGGYGGKEVSNVEADVSERVEDFINWLQKGATKTGERQKVVDLAKPIQYLTVDTITHLCFGKPLGFVKESRDLFSFLATIEQQLPIVQYFSVLLEFNWAISRLVKIPFLKPLIVPSANDVSGVGVILGISSRAIQERYAPEAPEKQDMLGSFKKHGITADEAETEVAISLVAGSDTTATSMRAILLMIISNPRVYMKLRHEIDDHASRGQLSFPITDAEARQMPYLQACIKEGLRRFPPITQLRERMSPPEGDFFKGRAIPAGTFVGINAWGLQLNPVYGEDAELFRPERWLEADAERLRAMCSVHELIFGHGSTRCLGIPIAMMGLNKIFVEILRRFDVAVADATRPAWRSVCYGIFFQKDFNVLITEREKPV